jgi:hypothetical protein
VPELPPIKPQPAPGANFVHADDAAEAFQHGGGAAAARLQHEPDGSDSKRVWMQASQEWSVGGGYWPNRQHQSEKWEKQHFKQFVERVNRVETAKTRQRRGVAAGASTSRGGSAPASRDNKRQRLDMTAFQRAPAEFTHSWRAEALPVSARGGVTVGSTTRHESFDVLADDRMMYTNAPTMAPFNTNTPFVPNPADYDLYVQQQHDELHDAVDHSDDDGDDDNDDAAPMPPVEDYPYEATFSHEESADYTGEGGDGDVEHVRNEDDDGELVDDNEGGGDDAAAASVALLNYLPASLFEEADKPLRVSLLDVERIVKESGAGSATHRRIGELVRVGRAFDSVDSLIEALKELQAEMVSARDKLWLFINDKRCILFGHGPPLGAMQHPSVKDVYLPGSKHLRPWIGKADVLRLMEESAAGVDTQYHVEALNDGHGRQFAHRSIDELVTLVSDAHVQYVKMLEQDVIAKRETEVNEREARAVSAAAITARQELLARKQRREQRLARERAEQVAAAKQAEAEAEHRRVLLEERQAAAAALPPRLTGDVPDMAPADAVRTDEAIKVDAVRRQLQLNPVLISTSRYAVVKHDEQPVALLGGNPTPSGTLVSVGGEAAGNPALALLAGIEQEGIDHSLAVELVHKTVRSTLQRMLPDTDHRDALQVNTTLAKLLTHTHLVRWPEVSQINEYLHRLEHGEADVLGDANRAHFSSVDDLSAAINVLQAKNGVGTFALTVSAAGLSKSSSRLRAPAKAVDVTPPMAQRTIGSEEKSAASVTASVDDNESLDANVLKNPMKRVGMSTTVGVSIFLRHSDRDTYSLVCQSEASTNLSTPDFHKVLLAANLPENSVEYTVCVFQYAPGEDISGDIDLRGESKLTPEALEAAAQLSTQNRLLKRSPTMQRPHSSVSSRSPSPDRPSTADELAARRQSRRNGSRPKTADEPTSVSPPPGGFLPPDPRIIDFFATSLLLRSGIDKAFHPDHLLELCHQIPAERLLQHLEFLKQNNKRYVTFAALRSDLKFLEEEGPLALLVHLATTNSEGVTGFEVSGAALLGIGAVSQYGRRRRELLGYTHVSMDTMSQLTAMRFGAVVELHLMPNRDEVEALATGRMIVKEKKKKKKKKKKSDDVNMSAETDLGCGVLRFTPRILANVNPRGKASLTTLLVGCTDVPTSPTTGEARPTVVACHLYDPSLHELTFCGVTESLTGTNMRFTHPLFIDNYDDVDDHVIRLSVFAEPSPDADNDAAAAPQLIGYTAFKLSDLPSDNAFSAPLFDTNNQRLTSEVRVRVLPSELLEQRRQCLYDVLHDGGLQTCVWSTGSKSKTLQTIDAERINDALIGLRKLLKNHRTGQRTTQARNQLVRSWRQQLRAHERGHVIMTSPSDDRAMSRADRLWYDVSDYQELALELYLTAVHFQHTHRRFHNIDEFVDAVAARYIHNLANLKGSGTSKGSTGALVTMNVRCFALADLPPHLVKASGADPTSLTLVMYAAEKKSSKFTPVMSSSPNDDLFSPTFAATLSADSDDASKGGAKSMTAEFTAYLTSMSDSKRVIFKIFVGLGMNSECLFAQSPPIFVRDLLACPKNRSSYCMFDGDGKVMSTMVNPHSTAGSSSSSAKLGHARTKSRARSRKSQPTSSFSIVLEEGEENKKKEKDSGEEKALTPDVKRNFSRLNSSNRGAPGNHFHYSIIVVTATHVEDIALCHELGHDSIVESLVKSSLLTAELKEEIIDANRDCFDELLLLTAIPAEDITALCEDMDYLGLVYSTQADLYEAVLQWLSNEEASKLKLYQFINGPACSMLPRYQDARDGDSRKITENDLEALYVKKHTMRHVHQLHEANASYKTLDELTDAIGQLHHSYVSDREKLLVYLNSDDATMFGNATYSVKPLCRDDVDALLVYDSTVAVASDSDDDEDAKNDAEVAKAARGGDFNMTTTERVHESENYNLAEQVKETFNYLRLFCRSKREFDYFEELVDELRRQRSAHAEHRETVFAYLMSESGQSLFDADAEPPIEVNAELVARIFDEGKAKALTFSLLSDLARDNQTFSSESALIQTVKRLHLESVEFRDEALNFLNNPDAHDLFGHDAVEVTPAEVDSLFDATGAGNLAIDFLRWLDRSGSRFSNAEELVAPLQNLRSEQKILIQQTFEWLCHRRHGDDDDDDGDDTGHSLFLPSKFNDDKEDVCVLVTLRGVEKLYESAAGAAPFIQQYLDRLNGYAADENDRGVTITLTAADEEGAAKKMVIPSRFTSVAALEPVIQIMHEQLLVQEDELYEFFYSEDCELFSESVDPVKPDVADVDQIFLHSEAGSLTVQLVQQLNFFGLRLDSAQDIIEPLTLEAAKAAQSIKKLYDFLNEARSLLQNDADCVLRNMVSLYRDAAGDATFGIVRSFQRLGRTYNTIGALSDAVHSADAANRDDKEEVLNWLGNTDLLPDVFEETGEPVLTSEFIDHMFEATQAGVATITHLHTLVSSSSRFDDVDECVEKVKNMHIESLSERGRVFRHLNEPACTLLPHGRTKKNAAQGSLLALPPTSHRGLSMLPGATSNGLGGDEAVSVVGAGLEDERFEFSDTSDVRNSTHTVTLAEVDSIFFEAETSGATIDLLNKLQAKGTTCKDLPALVMALRAEEKLHHNYKLDVFNFLTHPQQCSLLATAHSSSSSESITPFERSVSIAERQKATKEDVELLFATTDAGEDMLAHLHNLEREGRSFDDVGELVKAVTDEHNELCEERAAVLVVLKQAVKDATLLGDDVDVTEADVIRLMVEQNETKVPLLTVLQELLDDDADYDTVEELAEGVAQWYADTLATWAPMLDSLVQIVSVNGGGLVAVQSRPPSSAGSSSSSSALSSSSSSRRGSINSPPTRRGSINSPPMQRRGSTSLSPTQTSTQRGSAVSNTPFTPRGSTVSRRGSVLARSSSRDSSRGSATSSTGSRPSSRPGSPQTSRPSSPQQRPLSTGSLSRQGSVSRPASPPVRGAFRKHAPPSLNLDAELSTEDPLASRLAKPLTISSVSGLLEHLKTASAIEKVGDKGAFARPVLNDDLLRYLNIFVDSRQVFPSITDAAYALFEHHKAMLGQRNELLDFVRSRVGRSLLADGMELLSAHVERIFVDSGALNSTLAFIREIVLEHSDGLASAADVAPNVVERFERTIDDAMSILQNPFLRLFKSGALLVPKQSSVGATPRGSQLSTPMHGKPRGSISGGFAPNSGARRMSRLASASNTRSPTGSLSVSNARVLTRASSGGNELAMPTGLFTPRSSSLARKGSDFGPGVVFGQSPAVAPEQGLVLERPAVAAMVGLSGAGSKFIDYVNELNQSSVRLSSFVDLLDAVRERHKKAERARRDDIESVLNFLLREGDVLLDPAPTPETCDFGFAELLWRETQFETLAFLLNDSLEIETSGRDKYESIEDIIEGLNRRKADILFLEETRLKSQEKEEQEIADAAKAAAEKAEESARRAASEAAELASMAVENAKKAAEEAQRTEAEANVMEQKRKLDVRLLEQTKLKTVAERERLQKLEEEAVLAAMKADNEAERIVKTREWEAIKNEEEQLDERLKAAEKVADEDLKRMDELKREKELAQANLRSKERAVDVRERYQREEEMKLEIEEKHTQAMVDDLEKKKAEALETSAGTGQGLLKGVVNVRSKLGGDVVKKLPAKVADRERELYNKMFDEWLALGMRATGLVHPKTKSRKPNPYVEIMRMKGINWEFVARTEVVRRSTDVDFQPLIVRLAALCQNDMSQPFLLRFLSQDKDEDVFIGEVETSVEDVLLSKGNVYQIYDPAGGERDRFYKGSGNLTFSKTQQCVESTPGALATRKIFERSRMLDAPNVDSYLRVQIAATQLPARDDFTVNHDDYHLYNAYLEVYTLEGQMWKKLHRTETVDQVNPEWMTFSLSMNAICGGFIERPVMLKLWKKMPHVNVDGDGDLLIGHTLTSVYDMISNQRKKTPLTREFRDPQFLALKYATQLNVRNLALKRKGSVTEVDTSQADLFKIVSMSNAKKVINENSTKRGFIRVKVSGSELDPPEHGQSRHPYLLFHRFMNGHWESVYHTNCVTRKPLDPHWDDIVMSVDRLESEFEPHVIRISCLDYRPDEPPLFMGQTILPLDQLLNCEGMEFELIDEAREQMEDDYISGGTLMFDQVDLFAKAPPVSKRKADQASQSVKYTKPGNLVVTSASTFTPLADLDTEAELAVRSKHFDGEHFTGDLRRLRFLQYLFEGTGRIDRKTRRTAVSAAQALSAGSGKASSVGSGKSSGTSSDATSGVTSNLSDISKALLAEVWSLDFTGEILMYDHNHSLTKMKANPYIEVYRRKGTKSEQWELVLTTKHLSKTNNPKWETLKAKANRFYRPGVECNDEDPILIKCFSFYPRAPGMALGELRTTIGHLRDAEKAPVTWPLIDSNRARQMEAYKDSGYIELSSLNIVRPLAPKPPPEAEPAADAPTMAKPPSMGRRPSTFNGRLDRVTSSTSMSMQAGSSSRRASRNSSRTHSRSRSGQQASRSVSPSSLFF